MLCNQSRKSSDCPKNFLPSAHQRFLSGNSSIGCKLRHLRDLYNLVMVLLTVTGQQIRRKFLYNGFCIRSRIRGNLDCNFRDRYLFDV